MNKNATVLEKGTPQSASHNIFASTSSTISPGDRKIIPTGLQIAYQQGTYGRIAPRSGQTVKDGINIGAGVIDPDYHGKVGVALFNDNAKETFHIEKGDKIAQLIVEKIDDTPLNPVTTLDSTQRGTQGFGSTGNKKTITTANEPKRPDPPIQNKERTTQDQTTECTPQQCTECTSQKCTPCTDKKSTTQGPKTSMLATEMWHQRMGHTGLKKLQDTAKCTKGMPSIGQLHPLFKYRACAIAKITKTPK